ncbi:MAG: hypothetical protein PHX43_00010 [Alphaproteobacteria bacterium]|nr:hypothetical protein [Alphaproteobacteria bacterium]
MYVVVVFLRLKYEKLKKKGYLLFPILTSKCLNILQAGFGCHGICPMSTPIWKGPPKLPFFWNGPSPPSNTKQTIFWKDSPGYSKPKRPLLWRDTPASETKRPLYWKDSSGYSKIDHPLYWKNTAVSHEPVIFWKSPSKRPEELPDKLPLDYKFNIRPRSYTNRMIDEEKSKDLTWKLLGVLYCILCIVGFIFLINNYSKPYKPLICMDSPQSKSWTTFGRCRTE